MLCGMNTDTSLTPHSISLIFGEYRLLYFWWLIKYVFLISVSGSAFIPLYYKKSSNSIFLIGCYCFFHLSGSKSLYFSNGVFGCHSTVFSMTSLMYSNRLTPFCLHEMAIEYRIAPRLAPSCEPKNNEFLLDSDMYLWILSI